MVSTAAAVTGPSLQPQATRTVRLDGKTLHWLLAALPLCPFTANRDPNSLPSAVVSAAAWQTDGRPSLPPATRLQYATWSRAQRCRPFVSPRSSSARRCLPVRRFRRTCCPFLQCCLSMLPNIQTPCCQTTSRDGDCLLSESAAWEGGSDVTTPASLTAVPYPTLEDPTASPGY